MFSFFVGIATSAPVYFGMLILPYILWRRLDQRFLDKRGVPLWKKAIVYISITTPLFVTSHLMHMLMETLPIYPSEDEIQAARELHPRAFPISILPYFLGLLAGYYLIKSVAKVYFPSLAKCFWSLFNKLSGGDEIIQKSREWPCELHYFERAIENTMQPNRRKQLYEPKLLTKEFGYKKSSKEARDLLLKSFLQATFIIVLRRRTVGRKLIRRDLYRVKKTVVIAEDEDCLNSVHSRAPITKIKGDELIKLIDKHWNILLHQPNFSTLIDEDLIYQLRTLEI